MSRMAIRFYPGDGRAAKDPTHGGMPGSCIGRFPAGTWTVRASFKDNLRNTVLPLKTSFILK
jgi:hypothetical protein